MLMDYTCGADSNKRVTVTPKSDDCAAVQKWKTNKDLIKEIIRCDHGYIPLESLHYVQLTLLWNKHHISTKLHDINTKLNTSYVFKVLVYSHRKMKKKLTKKLRQ